MIRSLWMRSFLVLGGVFLAFLYALPNFYGNTPAVEIISTRSSSFSLGQPFQTQLASFLHSKKVSYRDMRFSDKVLQIRFFSPEEQLRGRDFLEQKLNGGRSDPPYTVALNLISAAPSWLMAIHAFPMYLGLDLRGGVRFLFQVDFSGAYKKYLGSVAFSLRHFLRDQKVPHAGIFVCNQAIVLHFWSKEDKEKARPLLALHYPVFSFQESSEPLLLKATVMASEQLKIFDQAIQQNISTLHKRVNELGVSEPLIQRQGKNRIVVELPGVQDVARAKKILGKTATLEMHLVSNSSTAPFNKEVFYTKETPDHPSQPLTLERSVLLTGDHIIRADSNFDRNNQPAVLLHLDSSGAEIFRDVTRTGVGRRLAIVLFENGVGRIVTAPRINEEIPNGNVQITGSFSFDEAAETALLLRAGALAAPMSIIEERTIGPSLGEENIRKGFHATLSGFAVIALFILFYYRAFGFFSIIALASNLLFLIAALSLLQATLTLPGIAAIALTLGMAIDANVLINERIREELRSGVLPLFAIREGYARAWATIVDSNVTTLIAGIALLIFGSGSIRGFAVVHCLGILTSLFSSVVISRTCADLLYLNRRSLSSLSIGQVWKPDLTAND